MPKSLQELFEGTELSKDMQEQVKTIFDAAVSEKADAKVTEAVAEIKAQLDEVTEQKEAAIAEAVEEKTQQLEDKVAKFVDHVVKEWAVDNAVAIEAGTKVAIAESLFDKFCAVLAEGNVKVDVEHSKALDEAESKVEALSTKLDEEKAAVLELEEKVKTMQMDAAFTKATSGLTESQVEKVKSLSEDIEFVTADKYAQKVELVVSKFIKESKDDSLNEDVTPPSTKSRWVM